MTHTQDKKQSIECVPKVAQKSTYKDFKTAILKMFNELMGTMSKELKESKRTILIE